MYNKQNQIYVVSRQLPSFPIIEKTRTGVEGVEVRPSLDHKFVPVEFPDSQDTSIGGTYLCRTHSTNQFYLHSPGEHTIDGSIMCSD